jgi:DNA polymerase-3 subunit beta
MIGKTAFSISQDDTRPHLASVFFESDGETARMISTDGHRLSKFGKALAKGPKLASGVLIPRKGVAEIRRAIEGQRGRVRDRDCTRGTSCFAPTTCC